MTQEQSGTVLLITILGILVIGGIIQGIWEYFLERKHQVRDYADPVFGTDNHAAIAEGMNIDTHIFEDAEMTQQYDYYYRTLNRVEVGTANPDQDFKVYPHELPKIPYDKEEEAKNVTKWI